MVKTATKGHKGIFMTPEEQLVKDIEDYWGEHLEMYDAETRDKLVIKALADLILKERQEALFYQRYYRDTVKK